MSEGSVPVGTVKPVATKGAEFGKLLLQVQSVICSRLKSFLLNQIQISCRIESLNCCLIMCLGLRGGLKVMLSNSVSLWRRKPSILPNLPALSLSCLHLPLLFFVLLSPVLLRIGAVGLSP